MNKVHTTNSPLLEHAPLHTESTEPITDDELSFEVFADLGSDVEEIV